jgi:RNA polymerase sigma factor (sigma-70 family)
MGLEMETTIQGLRKDAGIPSPREMPLGAMAGMGENTPMSEGSGRSGGEIPDPMFQRFRRGDPEATARAAEQAALVLRLRGYMIPESQRADLVQEVMTELWEKLGARDFRTDRAFDAYVRTLAYWRCIDWRRQQRLHVPLDPRTESRSNRPDEALLKEERARLGRRVIRMLRKPCRELIHLHAWRGLTYKRIAKLLGRSEGALRVQMTQCLKEARAVLERLGKRKLAESER